MSKKTVKKSEKIAADVLAMKAVTLPRIVFMETANWKGVKAIAIDDSKETSRAKFLRHIRSFDGETVQDWAADVAANPPATSKGKTAYTAKQWLTWCEKVGIVEISG